MGWSPESPTVTESAPSQDQVIASTEGNSENTWNLRLGDFGDFVRALRAVPQI